MPAIDLLKETIVSNERYNVNFFNKKQAMANSDQRHFKNGVGIFACQKGKFIKYYTPYIHTAKDTIADNENIIFITEKLTNFVIRFTEGR